MFSDFHLLLFYMVKGKEAPYLDITQLIQKTGC